MLRRHQLPVLHRGAPSICSIASHWQLLGLQQLVGAQGSMDGGLCPMIVDQVLGGAVDDCFGSGAALPRDRQLLPLSAT